jgi:hypothetical protein
LGHYATSYKIAGSNPIVTEFVINLPNPSSRTMVLGLTQPLTAMGTGNLFILLLINDNASKSKKFVVPEGKTS